MTTEMPPMEDSADPGNDVASALSETRLDIPFTAVNVITTALACVLPFFYYSRSSMIAPVSHVTGAKARAISAIWILLL